MEATHPMTVGHMANGQTCLEIPRGLVATMEARSGTIRESDAAEIARGAATGRPRVKFTSVVDMLDAVGESDDQSRVRRWPNAIRRLAGFGSSVPVGDFVPPRNRLR